MSKQRREDEEIICTFHNKKIKWWLNIADNKMADVDELKTRLIDEWAQFDQYDHHTFPPFPSQVILMLEEKHGLYLL